MILAWLRRVGRYPDRHLLRDAQLPSNHAEPPSLSRVPAGDFMRWRLGAVNTSPFTVEEIDTLQVVLNAAMTEAAGAGHRGATAGDVGAVVRGSFDGRTKSRKAQGCGAEQPEPA